MRDRLDLAAIRAEAVEASQMIADDVFGDVTVTGIMGMLSADEGAWLIDVPTYSRRRAESPAIPGSLYWR